MPRTDRPQATTMQPQCARANAIFVLYNAIIDSEKLHPFLALKFADEEQFWVAVVKLFKNDGEHRMLATRLEHTVRDGTASEMCEAIIKSCERGLETFLKQQPGRFVDYTRRFLREEFEDYAQVPCVAVFCLGCRHYRIFNLF
tara:strand:- start:82 stop:510 length:429 start_codon:yes stop_codon:yes gene_type:complete